MEPQTTGSIPPAPKTYRPKWADDTALAALMIERLGQCPGFESFKAGRDMFIEQKGMPIEEVNSIMVLVGLQRLSELLVGYQDASRDLGILAFGQEQDAYWIKDEFDAIGRPIVDGKIVLDDESVPL